MSILLSNLQSLLGFYYAYFNEIGASLLLWMLGRRGQIKIISLNVGWTENENGDRSGLGVTKLCVIS